MLSYAIIDMMKKTIAPLVKKVFHTSKFTLELLDKGITNYNYLLTINEDRYIVRIPKIQGIFDRVYENEVLQRIIPLDIDITPFYFDIDTGIKITPFIKDLHEFTSYRHHSKIEKTANILRKLHEANIQTGKRFNPLGKLELYQNNIVNKRYPYQEFKSIQTIVENYKCSEVLCHNDLVAGNICFNSNRTYLIDYEYAGDNDPLFDVMSFITENELTNKQEDDFLLYYFKNQPSNETRRALDMWRDFHNLLWLSWSNMMYDQTHEEIFLIIAEQKYQALKK